MFKHQDLLSGLNKQISLQDKLIQVHQAIQVNFPAISRIAVVILDHDTGLLKTFLESNDDGSSLPHYEIRINETESLFKVFKNAESRVINDLRALSSQSQEHHNQHIIDAGYLSSYTKPIFHHNRFFGFLFFNGKQANVFNQEMLTNIDVYGHMLSLLICTELATMKTLRAALKTSGTLTQFRDPETGAHLERMSRYSRLIAKHIAPIYKFDSEFIEQIFMYAPLHDIGKIGIPDHILIKPGKLTDEEMTVMKTHTTIGREIIDEIIENFCLTGIKTINMVRNIAEYHHESLDGSGYPEGLVDEEIPIEAKIVAVADIFDALTSDRPYKKAWSNQKAFAMLKELAGIRLDKDCVAAMLNNVEEVEEIQRLFKEEQSIYH